MTFSGSFRESRVEPTEGFVQSAPQNEPETKQQGAPVGQLIDQMVSLSSYIDKLYTQAHLIHLNIEGALFFPLHEFFKEQYQKHVENFDTVAELVRSMNYLMPMCEMGLKNACPCFNHVKSYEARDMAITYVTNLEDFAMSAKAVGELAREVGAPDVENIMADLVNFGFKSSWMLKATLRG